MGGYSGARRASVVLLLSLSITGLITYYADGVMDEVYRNRLAWGHVQPCAECIGMAAMLDRDHIGQQVWIDGPLGIEGPFLVVDCGNAAHRKQQEARHLIAEVDYQTAMRWGMKGPIEGRVQWETPIASRDKLASPISGPQP